MKRVSLEVIKALKEAGYKFTPIQSSFFVNDTNAWYSEEDAELYSLPYVMEVWLWLWREKNIYIGLEAESYPHNGMCVPSYIDAPYSDPEEAIIAAIEHLVNNDLIK